MCALHIFFFKQKTAYEMRISDWSSDVCSSDLDANRQCHRANCSDTSNPSGGPLSSTRSSACPSARSNSGGSWPALARVQVPLRTSMQPHSDRKSGVEGTGVSVRVDLDCRRIIKKKQHSA